MPLPSTPQRRLLTESLKMVGPLLPLSEVLPSKDTASPSKEKSSSQRSNIGVLEEVNLLDGLPISTSLETSVLQRMPDAS